MVKSAFSIKLAEIVGSRGLKRVELSLKAGLQPTAVSSIISSGAEPKAGAAMALARALGVCPVWMLDPVDTSWPPPPANARHIRAYAAAQTINAKAGTRIQASSETVVLGLEDLEAIASKLLEVQP